MRWQRLLLAGTLSYAERVISVNIRPTVVGQAALQPSAWVTVQSDGIASTVTPTIVTASGSVTTVSAAPSSLTQSGTWTLTAGGDATTRTGYNPVATATGPGEAGSFLLCNNYQGRYSPFCQPRDGSLLTSGRVYYLTWDPTYFGAGNATVQVNIGYGNSSEGFVSEILPGTRGFYSWNVSSATLQEVRESSGSLQATISLVTLDVSNSTVGTKKDGPTIALTDRSSTDSGSAKIDVLAVALPSILGITVLIIAGAIWVINRKRRGAPSLPSCLAGLCNSCVASSRRQLPPTRNGVGSPSINKKNLQNNIQLTDRDSWSATSLGREPHPGRNVFREELARQDRARG